MSKQQSEHRSSKKRRAKGDGGVSKRADGYWEATLDLGYDGNGKRVRRRFTGKSRSDVMAKLRTAQQDHDAGTLVLTSDKLTVADYMTNWLTAYARLRVRQSTYESYDAIVQLHVIPTLGRVPLTKLRADRIQALYAAKLAGGLSPRRVQYIHAVLRMAMRQAVENGTLARSPMIGTKPPRITQKDTITFTAQQASQFIDILSGERMSALYVIALTTGLRRGELAGLQWGDINWAKQTLTVNRTLVHVRGSVTVSEPKSDKSRRSVIIPSMALDILAQHREAQDGEKQALGDAYRDGGWVFCWLNGAPLRPDWITHHFRSILTSTDLPIIRLHDLRHTHATLLLMEGVHLKVVQERMGHSTPAFTMTRYIHVLPGMQQEAADKVDKLFH